MFVSSDFARAALRHGPVALQQPEWPDIGALRRACDQLATEPEPVDLWSCRALREELASAASGVGLALLAGDCAERFAETMPERVIAKAEHLHRVADVIETTTGLATSRIGRFGGQFAKPRSKPYEQLDDGRLIPSYRGDAVNGPGIHERAHDPSRLLTAHRCSRRAARALTAWDAERRHSGPAPRTYVGHEALLLDYETALLRHGGRHASSGHFLWVGDRTRDLDHAHVDFIASVDNPVGVKLGPSADPAQVAGLVARLDSAPGRVSLITRMGPAASAALPPLIEAVGRRARDVLWIVDPMHANGRVNTHGQKTRLVVEIEAEIRASFAALGRHGLAASGVHLEMTCDEVTECVEDTRDLTRPLPDYRSACDPRLNREQSLRVAGTVADLLASHPIRSVA
jgi:3-deoxy-7-phosphoheptulonate synthase